MSDGRLRSSSRGGGGGAGRRRQRQQRARRNFFLLALLFSRPCDRETIMSTGDEFRVFVGGLSWGTTDRSLEDAFRAFGDVTEAKVMSSSSSSFSSSSSSFNEKNLLYCVVVWCSPSLVFLL